MNLQSKCNKKTAPFRASFLFRSVGDAADDHFALAHEVEVVVHAKGAVEGFVGWGRLIEAVVAKDPFHVFAQVFFFAGAVFQHVVFAAPYHVHAGFRRQVADSAALVFVFQNGNGVGFRCRIRREADGIAFDIKLHVFGIDEAVDGNVGFVSANFVIIHGVHAEVQSVGGGDVAAVEGDAEAVVGLHFDREVQGIVAEGHAFLFVAHAHGFGKGIGPNVELSVFGKGVDAPLILFVEEEGHVFRGEAIHIGHGLFVADNGGPLPIVPAHRVAEEFGDDAQGHVGVVVSNFRRHIGGG